jgi:hypothetical protein
MTPLTILAFLQVGPAGLRARRGLGFHHGAAGHDHVVALRIQLDDLEFEFLAFQVGGVADRTDVDQRTGQESADGTDRRR